MKNLNLTKKENYFIHIFQRRSIMKRLKIHFISNLKENYIIINLLCIIIVSSLNVSIAQNFESWNPVVQENEKITVTLFANVFKDYIGEFIKDYEKYRQTDSVGINYLDATRFVKNDDVFEWMKNQIPYFDCPDDKFKEIYYFRWFVFQLHLKKRGDYFFVTEFLEKASWADINNVINCPAGHHIYEGRWLDEPEYMNSYLKYYLFSSDAHPRQFKTWICDAAYQYYLIHPSQTFLSDILDELVNHWNLISEKYKTASYHGMYWGEDWMDGMEYQIGGSGIRPSINAYLYGDAKAISKMGKILGNAHIENEYDSIAVDIKEKVQKYLWSEQAEFFLTYKNIEGWNWDENMYKKNKINPENNWKQIQQLYQLVDVRELIGYIPWYFNLPDNEGKYTQAWKFIKDDTIGFMAENGLSTAEKSHPFHCRIRYRNNQQGECCSDCPWDGPMWPFAETQTLVALANVLNNYDQDVVTAEDYFYELEKYTHTQYQYYDNYPRPRPWIGQSANYKGKDANGVAIWNLKNPNFYNHSGYCDLVISGLIGFRPQEDGSFSVNPLIPENKWDYFCLDGLKYRDKYITILYDKTGNKYNKGKGLQIYIDGLLKASAPKLQKLKYNYGHLPAQTQQEGH